MTDVCGSSFFKNHRHGAVVQRMPRFVVFKATFELFGTSENVFVFLFAKILELQIVFYIFCYFIGFHFLAPSLKYRLNLINYAKNS